MIADLPDVAKEQFVVRVTADNPLIEGLVTIPVTGNMQLLHGEIDLPQDRRSFTLSR